ncbi:MAG: hypothetical protein ACRDRX_26395 [Pseudonocardiaceae bacterium]
MADVFPIPDGTRPRRWASALPGWPCREAGRSWPATSRWFSSHLLVPAGRHLTTMVLAALTLLVGGRRLLAHPSVRATLVAPTVPGQIVSDAAGSGAPRQLG